MVSKMCENLRNTFDCIERLILDYNSTTEITNKDYETMDRNSIEIKEQLEKGKELFAEEGFDSVGLGSSMDIAGLVQGGTVCEECYEKYTGEKYYAD